MADIGVSFPVTLWATGFAIMVIGGLVKGTLGVGLPLVVVPMLSLFVPAPQAMGLLVMPVLLSNLWQTIEGGNVTRGLRRFGWLIVMQLVVTVGTVHFTRNLSLHGFNVMLALVVISAVVMMVFGHSFEVHPSRERWIGPAVGGVAGFMAGVSSLTGPILITYLMALRLRREEFIGAISIIYLFGAIPMYGAMLWYGRFGIDEVLLSFLTLVPMLVGLQAGRAIRHRLSEVIFRRLLLGLLTVLSVLLIVK